MASITDRIKTRIALCNLGRAVKLMWRQRHHPVGRKTIRDDLHRAKTLRAILRSGLVLLAFILIGCKTTTDEDQNPYDGTVVSVWSEPYDDTDPIDATFYSTPSYGARFDIDMVIVNDSNYELDRVIEVGTRTWHTEVYIYLLPGDRLRTHLITTSSVFVAPSFFRSYATPTSNG